MAGLYEARSEAINEGMQESRPTTWMDLVRFLGVVAGILFVVFVYLFFKDPYGRWGYRSSAEMPNLGERELLVSRALDPQFDAAIVGNSTSIPMQPEVLDRLTGYRFVSLSMSGSQSPAALTAATFFLRHHPLAKVVIIGLDDSWCTQGDDVEETHPFPYWLWGNDAQYLFGLATHLSWDTIRVARTEREHNRIDGYHPYDEAFHEHGFDDVEMVRAKLDKAKRPVQSFYLPPYRFEPPESLRGLLASAPDSVTFVLLWTPRYISIQPVEHSTAAAVDAACKQQVAELASPRVRIIDWSRRRQEDLDPANFYETNHYRETLAIKIEQEIAEAIRD